MVGGEHGDRGPLRHRRRHPAGDARELHTDVLDATERARSA